MVITRNRCEQMLRTLQHLTHLPEKPPVIVVDNGSSDDTVPMIGREFPHVTLVPLDQNLAAAGRNVGVARATTPYVAFSDDDSWWEPGALARAAGLLDRHRSVGVVAARVLVGLDGTVDPTSQCMATSPLPRRAGSPGPSVLGFLACGSVMRRQPFLDAGGFDPALGIGGEEELLALDLASAGWDLVYADRVTARHDPAPGPRPPTRPRRQVRNALRVAWGRLPVTLALRETGRVVARATASSPGRAGLLDAVREAPEVLLGRRVVPPGVADLRRAL